MSAHRPGKLTERLGQPLRGAPAPPASGLASGLCPRPKRLKRRRIRSGASSARDHAFTVTGGTVTRAQRLDQGSNLRWRITVEPDSSAAVTVVLPATTDCDDTGAVCTGDGTMLSNRLELTVSGPGG